MEIVDFSNLAEVDDALITLGNFDGFHQGQVKVLKEMTRACRSLQVKSLVFSFSPHPKASDSSFLGLIQDKYSKNLLFKYFGIDYVCYLDFEQIKNLEYYQFLNLLKSQFNLKGIVASEKLKFGALKKGSFGKVRKYFENQNKIDNINYVVKLIPCWIEPNGHKLSSSIIRKWLHKGTPANFIKINEALTLPFHLRGVVVSGRKLGRTIGFPTINFEYPEQIKIPDGSYATLTWVEQKLYRSITFIGNPRINKKIWVETYILNFNKDVYGKKVVVFFLDFLGPPEKAERIKDLKQIIIKHKKKGEAFFTLPNSRSVDLLTTKFTKGILLLVVFQIIYII